MSIIDLYFTDVVHGVRVVVGRGTFVVLIFTRPLDGGGFLSLLFTNSGVRGNEGNDGMIFVNDGSACVVGGRLVGARWWPFECTEMVSCSASNCAG